MYRATTTLSSPHSINRCYPVPDFIWRGAGLEKKNLSLLLLYIKQVFWES